MAARDIVLQICQVLAVVLLAPLVQGIILQFEERVQLAQGPGIFQPYRDLWKLFHKQIVVPHTASWIYWIAPFVAFTAMLTVPILIPVLTDFPLPLSDMGDILGGGLMLTLGSFMIVLAGLDSGSAYGGIGSSRAVMVAILAEPTLILVFVGITLLGQGDAALRGQSSPGRQPGGLFQPGASVPDPGVLHASDRRDRPPADPFQHPYRSLHDRRGPHPRIFRAAAGDPALGVDDEAVHPLHDLLQRPAHSLGPVARRHRARGGRLGRGAHAQIHVVACAVVVVETAQSRLRFYRYQELLAASFVFAILAIIGTQLV